MDSTHRISYAKDFIETFKNYFSKCYIDNEWDCADAFRGDEWKVDDDADYARNTCDDLLEMSSHDPKFQDFVKQVISAMKYNGNVGVDELIQQSINSENNSKRLESFLISALPKQTKENK